jgi:NADH-quinone oxidoreductase subunit C
MEVLQNDQIASGLKNIFGDSILNVEYLDYLTITVKREAILDIVKQLKEDSNYGFGFLTDLCGMHFPSSLTGQKEQLGVVYMLHSFEKNFRIRLKIYFPIDEPFVNSLTSLFSGANWLEREAYDFYGIQFKGHPNLKRIMNTDDFQYFPYRKNFPLEDQTRTDKNDSMFGR